MWQFSEGQLRRLKGTCSLRASEGAVARFPPLSRITGWRILQACCLPICPQLTSFVQDLCRCWVQDPVEADKLMKIQKELDETKIILVSAGLSCLPYQHLHAWMLCRPGRPCVSCMCQDTPLLAGRESVRQTPTERRGSCCSLDAAHTASRFCNSS